MFTLFHYREREDWSRLRRALAPKMLRPKDIRENLDNFNDVTRDAIDHMVAIRGVDGTIPDLEGELTKYTTEGKFCSNVFFFKFAGYRNISIISPGKIPFQKGRGVCLRFSGVCLGDYCR